MQPKVYTFTRAGVRGLDRAAEDGLGLPGIVLMENAAASVERAVLAWAEGVAVHTEVYCGPGNNGGDGFALARRLSCRGARVSVMACAPREKYTDEALINHDVVHRMKLRIVEFDARRPSLGFETMLESSDNAPGVIVVDALFGTGLDRGIGSPYDEVVNWMNTRRQASLHGTPGVRTLAIDLPSGLDCDSGEPLGSAVVEADRTVSLAGLKRGFANPASRKYTGEVEVGEIGVPPELLERFAEL